MRAQHGRFVGRPIEREREREEFRARSDGALAYKQAEQITRERFTPGQRTVRKYEHVSDGGGMKTQQKTKNTGRETSRQGEVGRAETKFMEREREKWTGRRKKHEIRLNRKGRFLNEEQQGVMKMQIIK